MDKRPDPQTMSLLREHLDFLRSEFSPEKLLLFGSRARGDHLMQSDIDLLVVSKKFEDIPFRERMIRAYGMWDKKEDLEQICYTPKEFEEMAKRHGIVSQAVREGILL